ncbi:hypothetical protein QQ045_018509 [Rhodiola kirilowii]
MSETHKSAPIQEEAAGSAVAVTMGATKQEKAKWKGKATAELKSCKAEQVWPLWADFCGIHKWFPNLAASYLVEGESGSEVGSVRYCVGNEAMWAKERLVEIDHEKRLMRYEVIENNVGLKGYVAAIRVWDDVEGWCMVEWRFEAEVVEGWGEEGLQEYVQSSLESIVKKMEGAV